MMKLRDLLTKRTTQDDEVLGSVIDGSNDELVEAPSSEPAATNRWSAWFGPRSRVPIYAGVTLIALGFGIAAYTWGKVAGLLHVPLQLPYIASGAAIALSLVVMGALLIWLAGARRDAALREERLDEIVDVLRSIAETSSGQRSGDSE